MTTPFTFYDEQVQSRAKRMLSNDERIGAFFFKLFAFIYVPVSLLLAGAIYLATFSFVVDIVRVYLGRAYLGLRFPELTFDFNSVKSRFSLGYCIDSADTCWQFLYLVTLLVVSSIFLVLIKPLFIYGASFCQTLYHFVAARINGTAFHTMRQANKAFLRETAIHSRICFESCSVIGHKSAINTINKILFADEADRGFELSSGSEERLEKIRNEAGESNKITNLSLFLHFLSEDFPKKEVDKETLQAICDGEIAGFRRFNERYAKVLCLGIEMTLQRYYHLVNDFVSVAHSTLSFLKLDGEAIITRMLDFPEVGRLVYVLHHKLKLTLTKEDIEKIQSYNNAEVDALLRFVNHFGSSVDDGINQISVRALMDHTPQMIEIMTAVVLGFSGENGAPLTNEVIGRLCEISDELDGRVLRVITEMYATISLLPAFSKEDITELLFATEGVAHRCNDYTRLLGERIVTLSARRLLNHDPENNDQIISALIDMKNTDLLSHPVVSAALKQTKKPMETITFIYAANRQNVFRDNDFNNQVLAERYVFMFSHAHVLFKESAFAETHHLLSNMSSQGFESIRNHVNNNAETLTDVMSIISDVLETKEEQQAAFFNALAEVGLAETAENPEQRLCSKDIVRLLSVVVRQVSSPIFYTINLLEVFDDGKIDATQACRQAILDDLVALETSFGWLMLTKILLGEVFIGEEEFDLEGLSFNVNIGSAQADPIELAITCVAEIKDTSFWFKPACESLANGWLTYQVLEEEETEDDVLAHQYDGIIQCAELAVDMPQCSRVLDGLSKSSRARTLAAAQKPDENVALQAFVRYVEANTLWGRGARNPDGSVNAMSAPSFSPDLAEMFQIEPPLSP
ncbi:MAG: hypothetical protein DHS20C10_07810 [marine bacterium B5-7]|nr:MAG: hypothetical protein DHS20C10_07810 [marine bacterium B5-7]